jgi:hypothetical protein
MFDLGKAYAEGGVNTIHKNWNKDMSHLEEAKALHHLEIGNIVNTLLLQLM